MADKEIIWWSLLNFKLNMGEKTMHEELIRKYWTINIKGTTGISNKKCFLLKMSTPI